MDNAHSLCFYEHLSSVSPYRKTGLLGPRWLVLEKQMDCSDSLSSSIWHLGLVYEQVRSLTVRVWQVTEHITYCLAAWLECRKPAPCGSAAVCLCQGWQTHGTVGRATSGHIRWPPCWSYLSCGVITQVLLVEPSGPFLAVHPCEESPGTHGARTQVLAQAPVNIDWMLSVCQKLCLV